MSRRSERMPNHQPSPQLSDRPEPLPALQMPSFALTGLGSLRSLIPEPLCFSLQRFLGYFLFNNKAVLLLLLAALFPLNCRPGPLTCDILLCAVSAHFSRWFLTCFEASPFVCCRSSPRCRTNGRWHQGSFPWKPLFHQGPCIVCTGRSRFPFLIFSLNFFLNVNSFIQYKSSEHAKSHQGENSSDLEWMTQS